MSESSVPVLYFLSPGKTKEMKEDLSDMSWTLQTQTLKELQTQIWFWASSVASGFDEPIQNPDLSHIWNVDPVLNWTLPVMCKFTSVSAINILGSEWSLARFSLVSASLISTEKRLLASKSIFSVSDTVSLHVLRYAAIRKLSMKIHTLFNMKIWLTFFSRGGAKKKKKKI